MEETEAVNITATGTITPAQADIIEAATNSGSNTYTVVGGGSDLNDTAANLVNYSAEDLNAAGTVTTTSVTVSPK